MLSLASASEAEYGKTTDVSAAVGECGIIITLVNKFEADNPDIDVKVTTVEWPGYDQLNAQLASRSAPDVVTMHYSAMSDYQSLGLLVPLDKLLKDQGIRATDFTDAAISSVTKEGKVYALPFDGWTILFHVNNNLMKKTDLMKVDGTPTPPTSRDELFAQGKQFNEAIGKPYLVQVLANETTTYARIFYTLMMQQNSKFFADPDHIDLRGEDAKAALTLMKNIMDKGLSTKNIDYPAAVSAFTNGSGGIAVNGTLMTLNLNKPITHSLTAIAYSLCLSFLNKKTPLPTDTIGLFLVVIVAMKKWPLLANCLNSSTTMITNGLALATCHLPTVKKVIANDKSKSLPHRSDIAKIATTGQALPAAVLRQFAIKDNLG